MNWLLCIDWRAVPVSKIFILCWISLFCVDCHFGKWRWLLALGLIRNNCSSSNQKLIFFNSLTSFNSECPIPKTSCRISHPLSVHQLRQRGYVLPGVCLSVCLSVCLLAISDKNYIDRIFMKIHQRRIFCQGTYIKFWKLFAYGSESGNLKAFSTLQNRAFSIRIYLGRSLRSPNAFITSGSAVKSPD